jgi:hypothetical protein
MLWDAIESRRLDARLAAIVQRNERPEAPAEHEDGSTPEALRLYRAAAILMNHSQRRTPEARNRLWRAWGSSQWTPETIELARVETAENREALGLSDRAAMLPLQDSTAPLPWTELEIGSLWQLARQHEYRAAVAASDGKDDDALLSFGAEARLVRAMDRTPDPLNNLLPHFTGLSWVLSKTHPSGAVRATVERAFADIDHDDRLRRDLLRYRRRVLNAAPKVFGGAMLDGAPRPLSLRALVKALDDFDRLLSASQQPWPQRIETTIAVGVWPVSPTPWPAMFMSRELREWFPVALEVFTRGVAEDVQRIRCARLLVSPAPLELVDPETGKRLEPSQCRL